MEDTDPVLLEKTLERRASGTAVRPNPRFSSDSLIRIVTAPKYDVIEAPFRTGKEEPEEELHVERSTSRKLIGTIPYFHHTWRVSFGLLLMGSRPAQLGPTSKSTNGRALPSTQNSVRITDIINYDMIATIPNTPDALGFVNVMFCTPPRFVLVGCNAAGPGLCPHRFAASA